MSAGRTRIIQFSQLYYYKKNAFEAWPGKTMSKGEDGWYTASAPVWVNSIIVNGNSGDVQTEDISIDAAEVWVTVSEDGTSDFTYNDPNAPVAEDITVHVKLPQTGASRICGHGPHRTARTHSLLGPAKPCKRGRTAG